MAAFIVNPAGYVHSVDDAAAEALLSKPRWREATEDEVANWQDAQRRAAGNKAARTQPEPALDAATPEAVADVPDGSIADVVAWVAEGEPGWTNRAAAALAVEREKEQPRKGLTSSLEAKLDAAAKEA